MFVHIGDVHSEITPPDMDQEEEEVEVEEEVNDSATSSSMPPLDIPCGDEEGHVSMSTTYADVISAFAMPVEQVEDKSMEHFVQLYFRNVVFENVKFLNDFVIQNMAYDGPNYYGGMLHKLLKYVGKEHLSVPERIKFWRRYAVVGKRVMDRQKSNKACAMRRAVMKGIRVLLIHY